MRAEREGLTVLNGDGAAVQREVIELRTQSERLGVADQLKAGEALEQGDDARAVVGFHVVENEVVKRATIERSADILQKALEDGRISSVKQGSFLVGDQVTIIGNTAWNREKVFETRETAITAADPGDRGRNVSDDMHKEDSF